MTTIDISFLRTNPLKLLIAFAVFYFLIAEPFFDMDFLKSVVVFALLFFLYKKYGNNFFDRFLRKRSQFGKRRRH